jgi:putative membrane protein
MNKKILFVAFAFSLVLFVSSCGSKNNDSKDTAEEQNEEKFEDTNKEKDTDFAVEAADAGMLEVQLGQLAVSNASSPQVKQFGQMMVDDHTKAGDELKALASELNYSLPASLSDKSMKVYNKLAEKSGADFDKEYVDQMVEDHKDVIGKFKKEADNGKEAKLQQWASEKLPTLQHHLQLAESAKETVKNTTNK